MKKSKKNTPFWKTPIIIAIIGATATVLSAITSHFIQGIISIRQDNQKFQSGLIEKSITYANNTNDTAVNLVFLANAGLIPSYEEKIKQAYPLLSNSKSVLPSGKTYGELISHLHRQLKESQLNNAYQSALTKLRNLHVDTLTSYMGQRKEVRNSLDKMLAESFAELTHLEEDAEKNSLNLRRQLEENPNDNNLVLQSLEADVKYFAIAAKFRDMELRLWFKAFEEMDTSDGDFLRKLRNATKLKEENLLNTKRDFENKFDNSPMRSVEEIDQLYVQHIKLESENLNLMQEKFIATNIPDINADEDIQMLKDFIRNLGKR